MHNFYVLFLVLKISVFNSLLINNINISTTDTRSALNIHQQQFMRLFKLRPDTNGITITAIIIMIIDNNNNNNKE